MKIKRKVLWVLALVFVLSFAFNITVSADTTLIDFIFVDTKTTLPTATGYKNDNEQRYYITLVSGNVSYTNIFGTRMRQGNNMVSNYEYHYTNHPSTAYAYTVPVSMSKLYYMNGKKDSASTNTNYLTVTGRLTF